MARIRVWYSTKSFADYIIDNTVLKNLKKQKDHQVETCQLYESDASKPRDFHTMPDHIKKILYLDCPDLIVEYEMEPIFSIEISSEAGTGHNAFQRFARIAAAAENGVPAIYIYPEAAIIDRRNAPTRWDAINPLIFKALDRVMNIYKIPALLYYYPSDYEDPRYTCNPNASPNKRTKGLKQERSIKYAGCPESNDHHMQALFKALSIIINNVLHYGSTKHISDLIGNQDIMSDRDWMSNEFSSKNNPVRSIDGMSPLTSATIVPTEYLINYLSTKHHLAAGLVSELLANRAETLVYSINAKFRGDPYPGALAAIDYLKCRQGVTFEERKYNLVLCWGTISTDDNNKTIAVGGNAASVNDFVNTVKNCSQQNLLIRDYNQLKPVDIPRYYMQVRYGSTYSKAKHIRVYSYFADAILFNDGSLWRDA